MHDSNRGDHTKIGLIAGIFVAALFVIAFAWPAFLAQREIQNDASRSAAHYSESAQKNVAAKCSNLAGQARADCAQPIEDAAREAQRGEYDLAAQETVAVWTAVMGGVAVFGVALSAVGVFLVWTTFDATRRANAIANEALDGQLRPWIDFTVSLRALKYEGGTLKPLVAVELFHHGVSPAIDYMFAARLFTDEFWPSERLYNFTPLMFDDDEVRDGRRTIFPGETWKVYPKLETPDIPAATIHATLLVAVQYKSPYSKTSRYTCKVFDVMHRKGDDRLLHLEGEHRLDLAYLGARNERGDFAN